MTKKKLNPLPGGRPAKYAHAIEKKCEACCQPFTARSPYEVEKKKFCSITCRNAANVARHTHVEWKCHACGKSEWGTAFDAKTRRFCSYECSSSFRNRGEGNPAWKGGNAKYWKLKARERDDFTCRYPGCGFRSETQTHAHHKIPRGAGGPDDLSNLVTFCNKHHHTIEGLLFKKIVARHPHLVDEVVAEMYAEIGIAS